MLMLMESSMKDWILHCFFHDGRQPLSFVVLGWYKVLVCWSCGETSCQVQKDSWVSLLQICLFSFYTESCVYTQPGTPSFPTKLEALFCWSQENAGQNSHEVIQSVQWLCMLSSLFQDPRGCVRGLDLSGPHTLWPTYTGTSPTPRGGEEKVLSTYRTGTLFIIASWDLLLGLRGTRTANASSTVKKWTFKKSFMAES